MDFNAYQFFDYCKILDDQRSNTDHSWITPAVSSYTDYRDELDKLTQELWCTNYKNSLKSFPTKLLGYQTLSLSAPWHQASNLIQGELLAVQLTSLIQDFALNNMHEEQYNDLGQAMRSFDLNNYLFQQLKKTLIAPAVHHHQINMQLKLQI